MKKIGGHFEYILKILGPLNNILRKLLTNFEKVLEFRKKLKILKILRKYIGNFEKILKNFDSCRKF